MLQRYKIISNYRQIAKIMLFCVNSSYLFKYSRQNSFLVCLFLKKLPKSFGGFKKSITFATALRFLWELKADKQEHSSVGSERFSHIEEVLGSSPNVPTKVGLHYEGRLFFSTY